MVTKVDNWLNKYLLHIGDVLDSRFYVDGVQEYREYHTGCRCRFPDFIDEYLKARWYLFTKQN